MCQLITPTHVHFRSFSVTTATVEKRRPGPFKQVTKGEGFIVVGMNYATDDYYKGLSPDKTVPEKAFFNEVMALVSARLNIATDYIFMGGYSQGGYSTTVLGEQLLERLAGFLILGAGRRNVDVEPPPAELIRGYSIFYGAGELDDPHYPRAKRAAGFYTEWGADVTFEGWKDETHKLSPQWMTKNKNAGMAYRLWTCETG